MKQAKVLLVMVSILAVGRTLPAADDPAERAPAGDPMAAMMAEIMKYATPSAHHEHLRPLAGTWKLSSRFRMSPEAPWSESTGRSTMTWILGGRFLQQQVVSPPSPAMPMAFEGFGLLGFDNLTGKHLNIWADNFMTGVMMFTGGCDASGKVITLDGEYADPKAGGTMARERWVYRIINDDKFIFEMWQPKAGGEDFLHGEITYTRVP